MEKIILTMREYNLIKIAFLLIMVVFSTTVDSYQKELNESEQKLKTVENHNYSLIAENKDLYDSMSIMQFKIDKLKMNVTALKYENEQLYEKVKDVEIEHKRQIEESQRKDFVMTHYVADCEGCIGITFTGEDVRDSIYYKNRRIIAVDRKVIPLGSIVEISDGDITFIAQALDIGSAIKGNKIDLLVESRGEALNLGVKDIKVRIIREGW